MCCCEFAATTHSFNVSYQNKNYIKLHFNLLNQLNYYMVLIWCRLKGLFLFLIDPFMCFNELINLLVYRTIRNNKKNRLNNQQVVSALMT